MHIRSVLMNAAGEGGGSAAANPNSAAPATTPETTPAAAEAPKVPGKKLTAGELKERFKAHIATETAKRDQQRAGMTAALKPADAVAAAAPTEAAAETAEAIADAGEKVPEQKEGETDAKYELRLAKQLQTIRELEAVGKREKTGREAAEKKAAEFEKQLGRIKDPKQVYKMLVDHGWTLEKLTKGMVAGEVEVVGAPAAMDPEMRKLIEAQQAEVERLKAESQQRAEEEQNRRLQHEYQQHTTQAANWLKQNADDYPLLAASGWAPSQLIKAAYGTKNPDLAVHAAALETSLTNDALALFGDERAVKKLAKNQPELRDKIAKALGLTKEQAKAVAQAVTAAVAPSRSVASTPSEATTPVKMTREEKKEQLKAGALARWREQQKAAGR